MQDASVPDARSVLPRWPARAYAAIAAIACLAAFVGFGASNYWTDELFTLHVIGHDGGLGEVWRRALTDTHPPLYYFLMYPWVRQFGQAEWVLRLPSAIFAVAAIVLFARGMRRHFSPAALGFAAALGALSMFWFEQSQNARGYALAMAISSALLAAAAALRERAPGRFPWALWAAVSALGLAGSLVHSYLLLSTGMVLLFLILSVRDWRVRFALAGSGLVILAVNLAYVVLLLRSTQQDVHNMWFDTGARFFLGQTRIAVRDLAAANCGVALKLLVLAWLVRRLLRIKPDAALARWRVPGAHAAQLAGFVLVGVIVSGIVVSYAIAPSFSSRNLLTASPFAWVLLAWLYDAAGPAATGRLGRWAAAALLVLVAAQLLVLRGRVLERQEAWRASAGFVAHLPGCAGQELAIMLPYKFGPSTPPFRQLAEHDFYGRYLGDAMRLRAWLPSELADRHPVPELQRQLRERAAQVLAGGCPALAWGVHDLEPGTALELAQDLARLPGVSPNRVVVQEFLRYQRRSLKWRPVVDGYVYLVVPPLAPGAPLADPGAVLARAAGDPYGALGDRVVVSHLYRYDGHDGPPYQLDGFSVQRWPARGEPPGEVFEVVQRLDCDPPTSLLRNGLRPDPGIPGCSLRPAR